MPENFQTDKKNKFPKEKQSSVKVYLTLGLILKPLKNSMAAFQSANKS